MENPNRNESDRMPPTRRVGTTRQTDVGHLVDALRAYKAGAPKYDGRSDRYVMGIALPSWQREFKWTDDQCVRFIESIWAGAPLGVWMVNVVDDVIGHPLDGLLVDGQQRLMAIERYLHNEFPVNGYDDKPLFWSELNEVERRRFCKTSFSHIETDIQDEDKLIEVYNTHNYGGTPHLPSERASFSPQKPK